MNRNWPTSTYDQPVGITAPLCYKCGSKTRKDEDPRDPGFPGLSRPPWNAGWNRTCVNCGHRFELAYSTASKKLQHLYDLIGVERKVGVRPANRRFRDGIDSGRMVSGIEIMVSEMQYGSSQEKKAIFLSMAEIRSLQVILTKELSICNDQVDWLCDWT